MALPDTQYIAFQGLQTYFVDKITGAPLSDGYVKFFSDVSRSTPKDVYQQVQLPGPVYSFVNIGSTVDLSSVGTFMSPDDGTDIQVYALPFDANGDIELYYLEIYSSDDVLQFTREAQPANASNDISVATSNDSDNIVSNPQFVITDTNSSGSNSETYTIVSSDTIQVAPDWYIVVVGSGTVTVSQLAISSATIVSGAPYSLEISSSGITSLKLRQTITESPRILGQGYVYGSLVAKSFGGDAVNLIMQYVASNGYTLNLVNSSTSTDGEYNTLASTAAVLANTTNSNSPDTPGYVNIDITIPASAHVAITSVQVVQVESATDTSEFLQQSVPRQIDHLFHYYKPLLDFKQIPSFLVGWDFPLNPAQVYNTSITTVSGYILDQTIAATTSGSMTAGTSAVGELSVLTSGANGAFYILQYLDGYTAQNIIADELSVNIQARVTAGSNVSCKVYLFCAPSTASFPTSSTGATIGTIAQSGVFTLTQPDWVEIPRGDMGTATGTLTAVAVDPTGDSDLKFNGWRVTSGSVLSDTNKFAIVVTFKTPDAATRVVIGSVSLVPGAIPTRPAPQAIDEVLRECKYYYEQSYNAGVAPGTVTTTGVRYEYLPIVVASSADTYYLRTFGIHFDIPKRTTVTPTIYSPASATADRMQFRVLRDGANVIPSGAGAANTSPQDISMSTRWTYSYATPSGGVFVCDDTTQKFYDSGAGNPAQDGDEGLFYYHYVADARIGIS